VTIMDSKKLLRQILKDIYQNIDDYTKDLLMSENLDIEFKGLSLQPETGKTYTIRSLSECDDTPSFEAMPRKYYLRKVNLKNMEEGLIIIHLSSRKAEKYSFEVDNTFEVVRKNYSNVSYEHRERIILWNELEDEELDKGLSSFDVKLDGMVKEITKDTKLKEVLVYIDVFMDLEKIENVVEKEDNRLVLWLHPVFLFSKEEVLRGLSAYELSKYDKSLIEMYYRDILEYCKEYRELCNKNLKIIEKIREIAVQRNDLDIVKEIDQMSMI